MNRHTRNTALVVLLLAAGVFNPSLANSLELPTRSAPRPETTNSVPHVQIGVEVMSEMRDELLQRVSGIADVEIRNSIISLPGAKGLWLADGLALAHPEVIVGGREFAHVHPDGSLHASLDPEHARVAVKTGWAVPHPWADQRAGWEGFVMIYSPTTADELDVVFRLVTESYGFVTGRAVD